MTIKKLILAPHVDDEVLGCGGILDSDSFVYFCGIDESKFRKDKGKVSVKERFSQLKNVANYLGFKYQCDRSTKVNYYDERYFINIFEDLINHLKPEAIYLPHPRFNQDHRTIFNAASIALRPHNKTFLL